MVDLRVKRPTLDDRLNQRVMFRIRDETWMRLVAAFESESSYLDPECRRA